VIVEAERTLKNCSLTFAAVKYSGSRPGISELRPVGSESAIASKDRARVIQSIALPGVTSCRAAPVSRLYCQIVITRSARGTGSSRMNSVSATLNIAVVAPIAIAKTSRRSP
jgi:hypothetical protein